MPDGGVELGEDYRVVAPEPVDDVRYRFEGDRLVGAAKIEPEIRTLLTAELKTNPGGVNVVGEDLQLAASAQSVLFDKIAAFGTRFDACLGKRGATREDLIGLFAGTKDEGNQMHQAVSAGVDLHRDLKSDAASGYSAYLKTAPGAHRTPDSP